MTDARPHHPIGARVVDRDDDDPDTAIVVAQPDATAAEWDVTDEHTVATYPGNEDYPADAPVVVIVFQDTLAETYPGYDGERPIPPGELADRSVSYYTFPASRLRPAPDNNDGRSGGADTGEAEAAGDTTHTGVRGPDSDLLTLAATLADRDMTVEYDASEDLIRVEQLGETYQIHSDGSVAGDGALRNQLEDTVDEVFS